jgi:D-alanyl-D-alanine carboxypeptidase (penicillin-binding protein 5/6)
MTDAARRLGALDTRPATPSGLDGPGMATSAYDLALIFRAAMRQPLFAATIATRLAPFPGYGDHPGFVVSNTDRFLPRYPGAIAGKSGFTDAARHTLVVAAQRGGHRLLAVLVRGEQRPVPMWKQAAALLDEGFALPTRTPPVGTLVDGPPTPTTVPPEQVTSVAAGAPGFGLGVAAAATTVAASLVAVVWWRRKRAGRPPV